MTNELTPEQIAALHTERVLDGLRTKSILTQAKINETPSEEIF